MSMTGLYINLAFLVIGLLICFFGVHLRKVCLFLLGGTVGSVLTSYLLAFTGLINQLGSYSIYVLAAGMLMLGILAITAEELFIAFLCFLSVLIVGTGVLMLFNLTTAIGYIVVAVVAVAVAALLYKLYKYSFAVVSSLIGALMTTLGGYGLFLDLVAERESSIIDYLFTNSLSKVAYIVITVLTLIFMGLGLFVQFRSLSKKRRRKAKITEVKPEVTPETDKTETAETTTTEGTVEQEKPEEKYVPKFCTECGAKLETGMTECPNCHVKL